MPPPLLPGVSDEKPSPERRCDARDAIRRARRSALRRDALQVTLLISVDLFFSHWPATRIPFATRDSSMALLAGLNALAVAHIWASRVMPLWNARRIASTWCRSERARFTSAR